MLTALNRTIHDQDGATMTEYGMLIALIALVAFAGIQIFGVNLGALFSSFAAIVQGSAPG